VSVIPENAIHSVEQISAVLAAEHRKVTKCINPFFYSRLVSRPPIDQPTPCGQKKVVARRKLA
jgi:hypothetical protein